ncbi:ArdC family protein [Sphingobium yanoikuyae]|uniref:ArdC family protein n=1 Tax=Sphingobium yanoikuyae TaxID=13690 RepID=UPI001EECC6B4|nr:zincin-like metallopeptidase domain-containing protein [Sphingobium yanoikuyae]
MTYKQAQALGAQVRKGAHGATVVYYGDSTRTVRDDVSGEDRQQGFRFLKTYTVFNVAQIDGLPERFHIMSARAPEVERIEAAEAFFASIPAAVNHGGDKAYYIPSADRIQLPTFAAFHDAHGYYTTRGHETVHWTRHKSRLHRSFGREKWGDEGYAREELVAELGAAFLAADLELCIEPRPDHASYIASWIKVLQNDTRAIVQAAAHAERAVAYLHQLATPDKLKQAA